MYPTNTQGFYLPVDGEEPQRPEVKSIPKMEGMPPEVIAALKRMGYPVEEMPMSTSDGINIVVPSQPTDVAAFQQVVEPSQQLADNFSTMLASQPQAQPQPYIPYLGGV